MVGLEVKVSRSDFLKGLRSGQFERYHKQLAGLYVVTTDKVCKTAEVPKFAGHLFVARRPGLGTVCLCRRHPQWHTVPESPTNMWRLIFALAKHFGERMAADRQEHESAQHIMADRVQGRILELLAKIDRERPLPSTEPLTPSVK